MTASNKTVANQTILYQNMIARSHQAEVSRSFFKIWHDLGTISGQSIQVLGSILSLAGSHLSLNVNGMLYAMQFVQLILQKVSVKILAFDRRTACSWCTNCNTQIHLIHHAQCAGSVFLNGSPFSRLAPTSGMPTKRR